MNYISRTLLRIKIISKTDCYHLQLQSIFIFSMNRSIVSIFLAVIAFACTNSASAHSPEMEQLADALNREIAGTDFVQSVTYDGDNLVFTMTGDIVSDDENALFEEISDPDVLKPLVLAQFAENLDSNAKEAFVEVLSAFNTNLKLSIPLKSGKKFDFIITPDDLRSI